MDEKWKILITSGPLDEEWLECEIWYDDEQFALFNQFGKQITIFPKLDQTFWSFETEEYVAVLNKAIEKLDGH